MTEEEFEVWYDAHDGARRHLKALSEDDVRDHIEYLRDQERQKQLLAQQFGIPSDPHEYNVSVVKRTTTLEPVNLD